MAIAASGAVGMRSIASNFVPWLQTVMPSLKPISLQIRRHAQNGWRRESCRSIHASPHVGIVLRKLSLDELPQLVNILRGEMSLVGPRPVVKDEIELYGSAATYYFKSRPGLTGVWQISGRNDVNYDERDCFR